MNGKNRVVNTRFWRDSFIFNHLNPLDRYLFLYLLTNDRTNLSGVYELPIKIMSVETGIEIDMIKKMFPRFNGRFLYVDGWVVIKNFTKYQNNNSPKIKAGIERERLEIPKEIQAKIIEIEKSGYDIDTISHFNFNFNLNSNPNSNSNFIVSNDTLVESETPLKEKKKTKKREHPPCPQIEIIKLYHEILPELPKVGTNLVDGKEVIDWGNTDSNKLRLRWNSDQKIQNLEWWSKFFNHIRNSKFLMGKVTDFKANLSWILIAGKFRNIRDGFYHHDKH